MCETESDTELHTYILHNIMYYRFNVMVVTYLRGISYQFEYFPLLFLRILPTLYYLQGNNITIKNNKNKLPIRTINKKRTRYEIVYTRQLQLMLKRNIIF